MVNSLLHRLPPTLQRPSLRLVVLGLVTFPGGSLFASPLPGDASVPVLQPLAQQETLVITCTGSIEASNLDFSVVYTAEREFSEIQFNRDGAAIASAQLRFNGRNETDQGVWRGETYGKAGVVLIHLSGQVVQPGDAISVSHNGQWGRGECAGSYWRGNQALPS